LPAWLSIARRFVSSAGGAEDAIKCGELAPPFDPVGAAPTVGSFGIVTDFIADVAEADTEVVPAASATACAFAEAANSETKTNAQNTAQRSTGSFAGTRSRATTIVISLVNKLLLLE
jgi:hypothetical protein